MKWQEMAEVVRMDESYSIKKFGEREKWTD